VIPVEEARQRILSRISPLGTERVDLPGAFGRVLSEDVAATRDIPPAMRSWPPTR
jgi:molybdopterin molybdotransferase